MLRAILPVVLALMAVPSTLAFLAQSRTVIPRFTLRALSAVRGDIDDLERARQSFESVIRPQIQLQPEYYTPPPLTASNRRRREVEMKLLEALKESDDAIDELMSLWMTERDADSAERLQAMEQLCSPGLVQEEAALRSMIDDYGLDWPEPANRLAALLYFKGKSDESMLWADRVLQVKPWHFEAIHLQRLNCLRLHSGALWRYARKALPPLNSVTNNASRRCWVERALNEAQHSLLLAEEQLHRTFGTSSSKEVESHQWQ
jgi:hypothetical protein